MKIDVIKMEFINPTKRFDAEKSFDALIIQHRFPELSGITTPFGVTDVYGTHEFAID